MMEKQKDLEKVGIGIAVMFAIYWIYAIFLQDHLDMQPMVKKGIGLISLYGIGFYLFMTIIRKIPDTKLKKGKVSGKTVLLCFLLQFTALMIMSLLTNVLSAISKKAIATDLNTLTPYMVFLLVIFNPIAEEFVFRKVFANKLLQYGELFYMLVSSFCFAIVHGVSQGMPQIIYTFILGLIWSYLVVKTGSIKLSIVLHALSNLFGSIVIQLLQTTTTTTIVGMYSLFMMVLAVGGFVCFIINKKKLKIDDKNKLWNAAIVKTMFTNKGILFYTAVTVCMMVLKQMM